MAHPMVYTIWSCHIPRILPWYIDGESSLAGPTMAFRVALATGRAMRLGHIMTHPIWRATGYPSHVPRDDPWVVYDHGGKLWDRPWDKTSVMPWHTMPCTMVDHGRPWGMPGSNTTPIDFMCALVSMHPIDYSMRLPTTAHSWTSFQTCMPWYKPWDKPWRYVRSMACTMAYDGVIQRGVIGRTMDTCHGMFNYCDVERVV